MLAFVHAFDDDDGDQNPRKRDCTDGVSYIESATRKDGRANTCNR